jgi:hypothetical protein
VISERLVESESDVIVTSLKTMKSTFHGNPESLPEVYYFSQNIAPSILQ